ncbi:sensory box sensor/GGDEF/EAL domain protein [Marinomonas sp. MED121]|uniref:sensor domain-containing protein n=1 Tax=Marinomonas sp. MED121 TaxID=314277 RepID=UPI0000690888|nr:EAL domain-containing protein [Marinomonas sp. MED121]EAQ64625.1 sensory box sensor/GGDEF/EAL domain protein [Marinomonas sp. MED121]
MEFLSKWFKSPVILASFVALLLFPCAWYTYSSFNLLLEDEEAFSFQHDVQMSQLTLTYELEKLTFLASQLSAQISSQAQGVDEYNIKHIEALLKSQNDQHDKLTFLYLKQSLNSMPQGISLVGTDKAAELESVLLSDPLSPQKLLARESSGSNVTVTGTLGESQVIGLETALNRHEKQAGFLIGLIDLDSIFKPILNANTAENKACLSVFLPNSRLLYQSQFNAEQCDLDVSSSLFRQREARFFLFDQEYVLQVSEVKPAFYTRYFSLGNALALLLLMTSSLTVFYIYRSRRYEKKIESLLRLKGQSLREVRSDYTHLFDLSVDGIYRASLTGNLIKANPAYAKAFGYLDEDELCKNVNNIGEQLHNSSKDYEDFISLLLKDKRVIGFEWQSFDLKGKAIWLQENAYLTCHENGEEYYEGFIANITEKKKAEIALKNQAQMDSLTGLLNRATFVEKMSDYIKKNSAHKSAIFFIDLDKFKTVNDQYGHHVGDELLLEFSRRLKACFSENEVISRLGGDEFAVFLLGVTDLPQLNKLADKVVAGLRKPFAFSNGFNFKISASIGISMLDETVKSASEGLKQADMAMYEVKRNGRADFIIFNQGLNETERRRSLLEKNLLRALKLHEIKINYQPIVCFETGEIKGMEALMRWHNELLGNVSPVEFIPIAEQTNLINPFSNWLIHQVCHDLKQLIEASGNTELFVSINISPKQLLSDQVCDNLLISLDVNDLKPNNIKLEITETAIYDQEESVVKQLRRIRSYGIAIYIDDFGTGYSSLERLIQYPFDGLKIDRSFVKNLVPGNSQDVILKASVKMAEMLNLVVVVEGIESHFQFDFFKALDCEYAQGFLLFKPLCVTDIHKLLVKSKESKTLALTIEPIS